MKNNQIIPLPTSLKTVLSFLLQHNIEPIVVGGYVRDYLINQATSKDIDVEVYNIQSYDTLVTLLKHFGKVNIVGKSFGVCKLQLKNIEIDFSLPRKEKKIASGHKGFVIDVDTSLNFCQASKRRDFTINALGYDLKKQQILDCFGGIQDLKNNILRYIDADTFIEDPLRFFRAIVFAARFELTLDTKLLILLQSMSQSKILLELPKERIFLELEKLFLRAKKPSIGLLLLRKIREKNYFEPLLQMQQEEFQTYISYFDTIKSNKLYHYFALLALHIDITQFSNDKKLLEEVTLLLQHHQKAKEFIINGWSDFDLKYFATKISWQKILPFVKTLYPSKKWEQIQQRVQELGVYEKPIPPKITGKDLIAKGLKPSKEFKKILHDLYLQQLKSNK